MANVGKGCRIFLHCFACVVLVAAVVLAAVALATPRWQEVTVAGSIHQHGLWRDCVSRLDGDHNPTDWLCEYRKLKLKDTEKQQLIGHQHIIESWRLATMILLVIAIFPFGFLGIIFGCVSACTDCCSYNKCLKIISILWSLFSLIAAISTAAACIIFFRYGYANDERKVEDGVNIFEQVFGSSYHICIASTVAFVVATIFAVIATVLLYVMGSGRSETKYTRTTTTSPPKYNVNYTAV